MSTADGKKLHDMVHKLTHAKRLDGTPLTRYDIAEMADEINATAVTPDHMDAFLLASPRCCVLRHTVRPALTRHLISHHAGKNREIAIVELC
jgi:hypothetical protein